MRGQMKKSEMLAQLYIDVDKFINEGTNENMVDFLLRRVEELGMKPPTYTKWVEETTVPLKGVLVNKIFHGWEDEA